MILKGPSIFDHIKCKITLTLQLLGKTMDRYFTCFSWRPLICAVICILCIRYMATVGIWYKFNARNDEFEQVSWKFLPYPVFAAKARVMVWGYY